ncbi:hypothetical protein, partial [Pseudomonas sp. BDAL1]|uniref:hypothetical protein n=1 Tax=Pseudomonas sp. BDAL1 TaxID=1884210 RepID=UPI002580A21C
FSYSINEYKGQHYFSTIVRRTTAACRSGPSASDLEYAAWRISMTRSVTTGIPTLEREER